MKVGQGEGAVWEGLKRAQQMPEAVDMAQMLDAVEATAAQLPAVERLRFAGEALLQVADLCATRASLALTEWEESSRDPIVAGDFFSEVVRQTMTVNLSDLMEPVPVRGGRAKPIVSSGSTALPVGKEAVLAMVAGLEVEAQIQHQQALGIAHSEDVTGWAETIAACLLTMPHERILLSELSESLGMAWIEVWLGVLFGGFALEQPGEFYRSPIWVQRPRVDQAALSEQTNGYSVDQCCSTCHTTPAVSAIALQNESLTAPLQ